MSLMRKRAALGVTLAVAATGSLALPAAANPAGTGLVISEVYGGGGNTGATYTNDFVELYNPTSAPISVAGMSVQYRSATGTTVGSNITALSGSVPAGGHYLVQEAAGTTVTDKPLPKPDATGTIAMAGAVRAGAAGQRHHRQHRPRGGNLAGNAALVDMVGYGAAGSYETAPTGTALTNTPRPPAAPPARTPTTTPRTSSSRLRRPRAPATSPRPRRPSRPRTPSPRSRAPARPARSRARPSSPAAWSPRRTRPAASTASTSRPPAPAARTTPRPAPPTASSCSAPRPPARSRSATTSRSPARSASSPAPPRSPRPPPRPSRSSPSRTPAVTPLVDRLPDDRVGPRGARGRAARPDRHVHGHQHLQHQPVRRDRPRHRRQAADRPDRGRGRPGHRRHRRGRRRQRRVAR